MMTPDMWSHKGWSISFDMKPIPSRAFDWEATLRGQTVTAATYEELLQEIEDAIYAGEDA